MLSQAKLPSRRKHFHQGALKGFALNFGNFTDFSLVTGQRDTAYLRGEVPLRMMNRAYYFDTNIWLDHGEKRGQHGKGALQLILRIIKENAVILYSDMLLRELRQLGYAPEEIATFFKIVKQNNLRHVHITREQKAEAMRIAFQRNIPKGDALHAILARDHDALLISRDQDFERLHDIVEARTPEKVY